MKKGHFYKERFTATKMIIEYGIFEWKIRKCMKNNPNINI